MTSTTTTTTTTTTGKLQNYEEFIIRIKNDKQYRSIYKTCIPCLSILVCLLILDYQFYHPYWWVIGLFIILLIILETGPQSEQIIEVVVTIYPLLNIIQLSTWRNGNPMIGKGGNGNHTTILPIDIIQDCIIHEYIGAFNITTHVMFRINTNTGNTANSNTNSTNSNVLSHKTPKSTTKLVQAFPGITTQLSFQQCYEMKNQIQTALEKVKSLQFVVEEEDNEDAHGDSADKKIL